MTKKQKGKCGVGFFIEKAVLKSNYLFLFFYQLKAKFIKADAEMRRKRAEIEVIKCYVQR